MSIAVLPNPKETRRVSPQRLEVAPRVCILSASVDAWNLGVAALGTSAVKLLREAIPGVEIVLQSYQSGKTSHVWLAEGELELDAINIGRGLIGRGGVDHLRLAGSAARRLGRWVGGYNPTLRQLQDCDAFLDVSAGDSFADIYGDRRFSFQSAVKLLALDMGKPLVLLPQTIGPFEHETSRQLARRIISSSRLVATRDVGGLEDLRQLMGGSLPEHIREVPDMAFLLDPVEVDSSREPLWGDRAPEETIGLNISGLLYAPLRDFGIKADYKRLVEAIAEWAVERCGRRLLLVPHVVSNEPAGEMRIPETGREVSDTLACRAALADLRRKYGDRVKCIEGRYAPGEVKHLIGGCGFFVGARMHACIGAITQCIPTATLAYSKKAAGVMAHLGMEKSVLDLRELSVEACIESLDRLYSIRRDLAAVLHDAVPRARERVQRFFEHDVRAVLGSR